MTATTLTRSTPGSPPPDGPACSPGSPCASLRARRAGARALAGRRRAAGRPRRAGGRGLRGRLLREGVGQLRGGGAARRAVPGPVRGRRRRRRAAATARSPTERPAVEALLARLAGDPLVASATSPWQPGGQVAADGRTGLGALRLTARTADAAPVADVQRLLATARRGPGARPAGRARRPGRQPGRAGRDRLGGDRPARRGAGAAADLRHRRRRRAADPGRGARAGLERRPDRCARRRCSRPRLVDLARRDDGDRRRHRLRAAAAHPLPRAARARARRPRGAWPGRTTPPAARSWSPAAPSSSACSASPRWA